MSAAQDRRPCVHSRGLLTLCDQGSALVVIRLGDGGTSRVRLAIAFLLNPENLF